MGSSLSKLLTESLRVWSLCSTAKSHRVRRKFIFFSSPAISYIWVHKHDNALILYNVMYTNSLSPPHPKQKQVALVKHTPESVTSCIYHRREHSLCIEVWSFKVGSGRAITRVCAVVRWVHASLTHIGVHNFSCNHLYCEYNSNCRNKSRAK